jgi:hypothetical protein
VRYTAVTCDPDEFVANRYALRPWLMGRKTELMIVLTSYNEGPDLLDRTLTGVIKNIAYLASRTKSKTWGNNAWQVSRAVVAAAAQSALEGCVARDGGVSRRTSLLRRRKEGGREQGRMKGGREGEGREGGGREGGRRKGGREEGEAHGARYSQSRVIVTVPRFAHHHVKSHASHAHPPPPSRRSACA